MYFMCLFCVKCAKFKEENFAKSIFERNSIKKHSTIVSWIYLFGKATSAVTA